MGVGLGAIHIHQAVPLGKALMAGHHIHKAPGAVAEHRQALLNHDADLLDVLLQVLDAVGVMDAAVRSQSLTVGHPVFGDDHGQAVAVVDFPHPDPQAHRVDAFVHPFGGFQVGIVADVEGISDTQKGG